MPDIGIAILTGGDGRRIGGQKAERLFDGRRLIDIAVAQAKSWDRPSAICVRRSGQVPAVALPEILDRADICGPLGGLLAAFDWAAQVELDSFLTIPCDMPRLPDDLLPRLRAASGAQGKPAVACCDGRRHPICSVWPLSSRDMLNAYIETGRRSLSGALDACSAIDILWRAEDRSRFLNVNQPEDLE